MNVVASLLLEQETAVPLAIKIRASNTLCLPTWVPSFSLLLPYSLCCRDRLELASFPLHLATYGCTVHHDRGGHYDDKNFTDTIDQNLVDGLKTGDLN